MNMWYTYIWRTENYDNFPVKVWGSSKMDVRTNRWLFIKVCRSDCGGECVWLLKIWKMMRDSVDIRNPEFLSNNGRISCDWKKRISKRFPSRVTCVQGGGGFVPRQERREARFGVRERVEAKGCANRFFFFFYFGSGVRQGDNKYGDFSHRARVSPGGKGGCSALPCGTVAIPLIPRRPFCMLFREKPSIDSWSTSTAGKRFLGNRM